MTALSFAVSRRKQLRNEKKAVKLFFLLRKFPFLIGNTIACSLSLLMFQKKTEPNEKEVFFSPFHIFHAAFFMCQGGLRGRVSEKRDFSLRCSSRIVCGGVAPRWKVERMNYWDIKVRGRTEKWAKNGIFKAITFVVGRCISTIRCVHHFRNFLLLRHF